MITLSSILLLVGCAEGDGVGAPDSGSTLTVLYATDERSLYPASDDVPLRLLFSPLVSDEPLEGREDRPLVPIRATQCRGARPELAERWEHSADWRVWRITLRENLHWHDGAPITAHDFAFTVRLWKRPDVGHWAGAPIDSVHVEDNLTFQIHYNRPSRDILNGWDVFYPKHLLEGLDPAEFWDWEFWSRPVGSGPFRYVRHIPGQMVELEAVPSYPVGAPQFERLFVKWGGGSPLAELRSGSVDAVEGVDPLEAAALERDARYEVHHLAYPGGVRIFWNHRLPLLREPSVRTAFTQAIDRAELHRILGLPEGLPVDDGLHSPCQTARGELPEAVEHDPAAAAELLTAAGWTDEDGDGIRERAGQPLSFTLDVPAGWLQAPQAATYVQERLARLGVGVEIRSLELPVVGERFQSGDFEALIWVTGPWPDHHIERFGEGSWLGYENARLAALLEQANRTMEHAAQDSLYREISAIYRADMPATYLYPKVDMNVTTDRVLGYSSELGDLILNLHRLSLAKPR
jgi:peptide/nickel transport system substrate-binding protein